MAEGIEAQIATALAEARGDEAVTDSGDEGTTEVVEETDTTADEGTGDEGETETTEEDTEADTEDGEEGEGDEESEEESDEDGEEEEDAEEDTDEEEDVDPDIGPEKDKNGNVNRIPQPRVKKMIAKKIQGLTDVVGMALGFKKGQITTQNVAEALGEVQRLRAYYDSMQSIEPIMRTNGKEFIKRLAEANPEQYARYAEIDSDGYVAPAAAAAKADMPGPDVEITLPDGTKGRTWSQGQMEKRDAWLIGQAVAAAKKEFEGRIKPFETDKANREKADQDSQVLAQNIKDLLTEAREDWDGFTENEAEIRKVYNSIPKTVPMGRALRQAYNKVVIQKLKKTKADIRKGLIEEGKKAPKKTTTKGKVLKKKDVVRGEDGQPVTGIEASIRTALADARAAGELK